MQFLLHVLVDDGQYRGYGFIEDTVEVQSKTDIEAFLIHQKNTPETQRIVESMMSKLDYLEL